MKFLYTLLLSGLIAGLFASCGHPEIDEVPEPQPGALDLSTYVALGNSLTAGFLDNALYREGQLNSYPNLMANQFAQAGGGTFIQPLVPEGNGINIDGDGRLIVVIDPATGELGLSPTEGNPAALGAPTASGPYNNLGVPGAKSFHLLAEGYGQANPFFGRFATTPATSVVADAAALNPTFFTLWIGNNDVLGYALAGGVDSIEEITSTATFNASIQSIINTLTGANNDIEGAIANIPDVLSIPFFNVVQPNAFALTQAQADQTNARLAAQIVPEVERQVIIAVASATAVATEAVFQQVLQQALADGATPEQAGQQATVFIASEEGQEAIAAQRDTIIENLGEENLPEPLATLVGNTNTFITNPAARPAELQQQIDLLISTPEARPTDLVAAIEDQLNTLQAAGFYPVVQAGNNPFIIEDPASPTGIRSGTSSDLFLLSISNLPAEALVPLSDAYVLTPDEIAAINEARVSYNNILEDIASNEGFAFVDIAALFDRLVSQGGIFEDGILYSDELITGNTFSLDGIHLTPAGAAFVANRFINAINRKYNAGISPVSISSYRGNGLP